MGVKQQPRELREPRRVRSSAVAVILALLGLSALTLGLYALLAPSAFYTSFPLGRGWVAMDGPFNEHLVRDFGGLNLALAAATFAALATMTVAMVRTAAIATLLFGVPHLLYHLAHLGMYGAADQIGNVIGLGLPVLGAIVVLVLSRRRTPGPGTDRGRGRHRRGGGLERARRAGRDPVRPGRGR